MARILLGVTGGIAAYKACELVRLFVKHGHDVLSATTPEAERFVSAETLHALARRPRSDDPYPHLARVDLLVVAPLTANTLAKLAHGLADNVLTEAALAHRGPFVVAPAMNPRMWAHPATQANIAVLRERGVEVVGPALGDTAEGEQGVGRMAEPEEIFRRCLELLAPADGPLAGRTVLVSAGGTREPIDAVRYVGNRSSGRMGVAVAREAARRGARVTLVGANLAVPAPEGVELVAVETAAQLAEAVLGRSEADVVVMAAAVADYRPVAALEGKRPKDATGWAVELEPTQDVLRTLGERRVNGQVLVGFAADIGEAGLARAREKRTAKNATLLVFNDVGRADIGFDAAENEVVVIGEAGDRAVAKAPKEKIAAAIVDEIEKALG